MGDISGLGGVREVLHLPRQLPDLANLAFLCFPHRAQPA